MNEAVEQFIEAWLSEEITQSHVGRNVVLDDYNLARDRFLLPLGPESKVQGHHFRYQRLCGQLAIMEGDDVLIGKLLHHSLMFASGGFRNQCFLQASSAEEYRQLRFKEGNATGIVVAQTIDESLTEGLESYDAVITVNQAANDRILALTAGISDWFLEHPMRSRDGLTPEDDPVQAMIERQKLAVAMTVNHLALAVQAGAALKSVPVLEPKSVTDAELTTVGAFLAA